jgi:hypothetical protein
MVLRRKQFFLCVYAWNEQVNVEGGDTRKRETGKRTQLFPNRFEFIQIRLVLSLILHLFFDTLKNPDRGRIVVHPSGRTNGRLDDGGCGYEIVRKAIVQSALDLEQVLGSLEKVDVALGEGFERLLVLCT